MESRKDATLTLTAVQMALLALAKGLLRSQTATLSRPPVEGNHCGICR